MFTTPIQPLHDRVLISDPPSPAKAVEREVGGIIIPADVKGTTIADIEKPYYVADVLAVGPDCKLVKKGYRVIVARRDAFAIAFGEQTGTAVREGNIVAILP